MGIAPLSERFFHDKFDRLCKRLKPMQETPLAVYGIEPRFAYLDFILTRQGIGLNNIVAFIDRNYRNLQDSPLSMLAPIYGPGSLALTNYDALVVLPHADSDFRQFLDSFQRKGSAELVLLEPEYVENLIENLQFYFKLRKSELCIALEKDRERLKYPSWLASRNFDTNVGYINNTLYWEIRALTHLKEIESNNERWAGHDQLTYLKNTLTDISCKGDKILDFGCGPGITLSYLISEFTDCQFYGTDISRRQLTQARQLLQNAVKIIDQLDLQLPFSDRYFDICYTTSVFDHISYPEIICYAQELARVSKRYLFLMEPSNTAVSGYQSEMFNDGYHFDHHYERLFNELNFNFLKAFPTCMGSNLVGMLFERKT